MKKIAIAGGAPILVCKTELIRGGTWLPDDTIVFGSMGTPLQRVSSGGGAQQELTRHSTDNSYWPSALNDGQHVLYTIGSISGNYDQAEIEVVSLREGRSHAILKGGTSPRYARGHLIYSHAGTLFAVPFDADQLKVIGSPVPIANDVAGYPLYGGSYFDVADDGTVCTGGRECGQIQIAEVSDKGGLTKLGHSLFLADAAAVSTTSKASDACCSMLAITIRLDCSLARRSGRTSET